MLDALHKPLMVHFSWKFALVFSMNMRNETMGNMEDFLLNNAIAVNIFQIVKIVKQDWLRPVSRLS